MSKKNQKKNNLPLGGGKEKIADQNELEMQQEDEMMENAEYGEAAEYGEDIDAEQLVADSADAKMSNREIEEMGSMMAVISSSCAEPMSDEEIRPLVLKAQEGDEEARNEVIMHNLRLVYAVAQKRYTAINGFKGILSLEDMVQSGCLGLNQAILHFNPNVSNKFSTYAVFWIRQEIDRSTFNTGRNMRRPPQVVEAEIRISNAVKKVTKALGREPEMSELEVFFKGIYTRDQLKTPLDDLQVGDTISLSSKLSRDERDEGTLMDLLQDDNAEKPDALKALQNQELCDAIMDAMKNFTEKQRMTIILLYGLEDGIQRTDIETARKLYELGYSDRVCSRQCINSLRQALFQKMAPKLAKWKDYIA